MNRLFTYLKQLHQNRRSKSSPGWGQGIIEYVLILAFAGLVIVVIVQAMEPAIADVFSRLVNKNVIAPPPLAGYTPPSTNTATATIDPNATPTFTLTPSLTPTETETPLVTNTPTNTSEPTATNSPTSTATPAFIACEYEEAGGTVVIEAENFASQDLGSGNAASSLWVATNDFAGYSGATAMQAPNNGVNTGLATNGPRLNYPIRINTAGSYYIYVRGRPETPDSSNNDSFHAGVDGTAVTLSGAGFTGYDGNASNFHWRHWSVPVSLTAGQRVLNIWMREDGMVIDRVMLSTNGSLISDGSTETGPASSNAPAGCSGAPPPPATATPTITPTPGPACAPTGSLLVRINFQRAGDPVPAGYEKDDGSAYGNRGNGFSYGWSSSNTGNARDRNNGLSPDQRYDTLNHMQQSGTFDWEIGVPSGTYEACLVAGDPSYTNSVHRINVEGTLAVDFTPTSNDRWGDGFVTVNVGDGRLTVDNASGSNNNKINFIEIYTVSIATPTNTPIPSPTSTPGAATTIYTSSTSDGTAGSVSFKDEDILTHNTSSGAWAMYIDGSDVGLGGSGNRDVDAFFIMADGSILLSFTGSTSIPDVGNVDDSDIVRFTPTSTGDTTSGSFSIYFDGSDVSLSNNSEDIDAVTALADGRILISTTGNFSAGGVSGKDEDLLAFTPTQLGSTTSGSWAMYFDGSDVKLKDGDEDITGVWVDDATGDIYLTTKGPFSVSGASGDQSDIFVCVPGSLGGNTSCAYSFYWDGSANGYSGEIMDGLFIDLP